MTMSMSYSFCCVPLLNTMTQACNPSYLGNRGDHSFRPAYTKKFERPHLNGKKLGVVVMHLSFQQLQGNLK
jgi:hypothetical protein